MTMQSRKELALIMLIYGSLLNKTQARTICSCYNDFRFNNINRLFDTFVGSQQCDACSDEVDPASLTDTCDGQHSESLRREHEECGGPTARIRYYRCDLREGVYTCRIPRRINWCAVPFYSSLLLKYRTSLTSSAPMVLINNLVMPTVSLGSDCSKLKVCIEPLPVSHNPPSVITLAFSITGSDEMLVNDVIATVYYKCPPRSRVLMASNSHFPFNINPFTEIDSATQEQMEILRSG